MKYVIHIAVLMVIIVCSSCSTQKNTALSRSFHQTTTYYNIYYNGRLNFDEGIKNINTQSNTTDDYSGLLCMYPVSNHTAAKSATSKMDAAIEKCRKCIKLHSIKQKPKRINHKQKNDPKYQQWLRSKEFNNKMYLAWMMLGQSEFHKGEFLGAIGTFNYVYRLYDQDKDLQALCQLWVVRSYAELGWLYEAEDMINKVKIEDLKAKNRPFYSAVMADLIIKMGQTTEALPYLKQARQSEKRKGYRARFEYIIGQLYQLQNQYTAAMNSYKQVTHLNPSPELDFHARLHYAELESDTTKSIKRLLRLAHLSKNKDRLDDIYGTAGNIYLQQHDTINALIYYQKAIDGSTKNGSSKASILIKSGDIYFQQTDYAAAQPLYSEAIQILSNEHPDYKRIRHYSEVLEEVVVNTNTIELQDSLQHLATLTEDEQIAIIDKIIADLIAQEQADSIKAAQEAREAELGSGISSVDTRNMLGGNADNNWYFYNAQLLKSGKQDFSKRWGKRPLEDDWRRQSKAISSSFSPMSDEEDTKESIDEEYLSDSTQTAASDSINAKSIDPVTDPHERDYYLQQIPKTEEDIITSNNLIADALINLISIYREKLGSQTLSDEAFNDFCRRFPNDSNLVDLYYMQYLNALRMEDEALANQYRQQIIDLFPNSEQARIVADKNYFERLTRIAQEQDSLYAATYEAYRTGEYSQVKSNKAYAEQNLSLSPLMPRFLFLNAIAVAKTEGQDVFIAQLRDMVNRYPKSELGSMARDMLALMTQGEQSQADGASTSTLSTTRVQTVSAEDSIPTDVRFLTNRNEPSMILIVLPTNEENLNTLLYEVALYNFTQFLIKDFDLHVLTYLSPSQCALQIKGFDSMDEADWYMGLINGNADMKILMQSMAAEMIPISESNYKLIGNPFRLEDYKAFMQND